MSRETLLEYDRKRTAMEQEMAAIVEFLNGPGMPGLHQSLVDEEGFPLANIDLYKVREARNRHAVLNTDLSEIMKLLENEMYAYHANLPPPEEREETKVPVEIGISTQVTLVPFAIVDEVAEGGPAEEAGIHLQDKVLRFGMVTRENSNNLQALPGEVKPGVSVKILVLRKNPINVEEEVTLALVPR